MPVCPSYLPQSRQKVAYLKTAKDFVSKLVVRESSQRLSIEDALSHRWFAHVNDDILSVAVGISVGCDRLADYIRSLRNKAGNSS